MPLDHRIVHLDLKGAPWKIPYLEKVILRAKAWGATGILFEWEDTFPYTAELVDLGSVTGCGGDGMYTMEEVQHIMRFCNEHNLEVIQLIQTIGHMEFVLKHSAFAGLRENPDSPTSLCPSKPESQVLVRSMLEQVLDAQPDATYLHIGADEVWYTGLCTDCKKRIEKSAHGVATLYLEHIQNLALFLKEKRPNLTVLMWDDMLRPMSVDILKSYNIGDLVQPVLWDYNVIQCFQIKPDLWQTYGLLFSKVWAASAFKGANGIDKAISPMRRYVSNHLAWMIEIEKYPKINFAGIILTGWSRYDHFKTLCELMPVSLPSLASCLRIVTATDDAPSESLLSEDLPSEEWPGERLAQCIRYAVALTGSCQKYSSRQMNLPQFQAIECPDDSGKVWEIPEDPKELLKELLLVKDDVTTLLSEVTGKRSTDEWVQENVMPAIQVFTEITK